MTTDLRIDTASGDLAFTGGLLQTLSGLEAIAQRMRIRLLRHRGEYHLDRRKGVPYISLLQRKPADLQAIAAVFRAEILSTPGVVSVAPFDRSFDPATATASLSTTVVTEEGRVDVAVDPYEFYRSGGLGLLIGPAGSIAT